MKDIKLDFLNKKLLNTTVDKTERIIQQIKVGLRSYTKDFFLNENFGVNYNITWHNPTLMKLLIKEQTEAIPGVLSVKRISITPKRSNVDGKYYIVDMAVSFENETINILEEI